MMGSTRSSRQRAKNVRRLFARSGVATLFALALAAPASSAGFVTAVTGVAEVKSGGTSSWTAATRDTQLSVGDALRTQKKASLQALLPEAMVMNNFGSTETGHQGAAYPEEEPGPDNRPTFYMDETNL